MWLLWPVSRFVEIGVERVFFCGCCGPCLSLVVWFLGLVVAWWPVSCGCGCGVWLVFSQWFCGFCGWRWWWVSCGRCGGDGFFHGGSGGFFAVDVVVMVFFFLFFFVFCGCDGGGDGVFIVAGWW